jgi:hypothetical protein
LGFHTIAFFARNPTSGCKQSLRFQGSQKGAAKPAETRRADQGLEEKIVRCAIGFYLIRQSSAIPIVCFQQSKQTLAHTSQ